MLNRSGSDVHTAITPKSGEPFSGDGCLPRKVQPPSSCPSNDMLRHPLSVQSPTQGVCPSLESIGKQENTVSAILQRTIETTDNALTRLRAKEMIGLLDSVRRMDGFDYALMLRTLDFIEVHSKEKMTVVFQSDIRISVVENWATLLIFGSVEGAISKSVAQFIALIFAYIMP